MKNLQITILTLIILINVGCDYKKGRNSKDNQTTDSLVSDTIYWISDDYVDDTPDVKKFKSDLSENSIKTQKALILLVEPILFKTFGRDHIIKERPYHIGLKGDIWVMKGTCRWERGGAFIIRVDRRTGKVVDIMHEK